MNTRKKNFTRGALITMTETQRTRLEWLGKEVGVPQAEVVRLCIESVTPAALRQMIVESHQRQAEAVMKGETNGSQLLLINNKPKRRRKQRP